MADNAIAKGRVVRPFRNVLENGKLYTVGDVFTAPAVQVANMARRGYVEAIEAPAEAPETPAEPPKTEEPAKEAPAPEKAPEEPEADGVGIEDIKPKKTASRRRSTAKKATE